MMRLDVFLTENGYFSSRAKSCDAIKDGLVSINGNVATKASKEISDNDNVTVSGTLKFVSKGGYKLDKALTEFGLSVEGLVFADIGASTGGFTDCLLKRSAKKVYAVDVGEGQLDKSLSLDERVVVMDNINARYLTKDDFNDTLDGITADCSFISLKLLVGVFDNLLPNSGILLALIKPQFECGRKNLSKNGILKDTKVRETSVLEVVNVAKSYGFNVSGISQAPLNKDKNVEYVIYFAKEGKSLSENDLRNFLRQ